MSRYAKLAIEKADDLRFGVSPHPLRTRQGLLIGGGRVYPELNFTLPDIDINAGTQNQIAEHYRQIIREAADRAVELEAPGLVVEFETLPPMTEHPDWGMMVVKILVEHLHEAHEKRGLKSAVRVTPNDNREFIRPPVMRSGYYWENMVELFDRAGEAGAELLSIESVGGKELHDEALQMCDLPGVIFSLCVLGARDMRFLWTAIHKIAGKHGVHAAGDTACGFGNTAMMLAEKRMIPRVFAAVVRAVTAVRSLVAYECGAVGPGKDCGYENPILKAITGYPMAMEGKTSACAHLSPVGNITAAVCDTWSNESVQNIKLLGGMAPTCYLEQLIYDCRLLNEASEEGEESARALRRWLIKSDAARDPQAWILSPYCVIELAKVIVRSGSDYEAGKATALRAIALLREGQGHHGLKIEEREQPWLDMMESSVENLPDDEASFIDQMMEQVDRTRFVPEEYDLS